ncbi:MAG: prolyl oligopeptidase family serine peptidase [Phycisphaerales bacterium]|nr:prolyl oligopeptidase family serine peptidase [Phycisphaerales bacterium]
MLTTMLHLLAACAVALSSTPAAVTLSSGSPGGDTPASSAHPAAVETSLAMQSNQPTARGLPAAPAVPATPGVHFCSWADLSGTHRFAVYIPPADIATPPYPLVVFLHGRGESGTDGVKQASVGLLPAVLNQPQRWPCVILMPQKPEFEPLWPTQTDVVMAELKALREQVHIDENRISLTGLSQGGHGTWMFAMHDPGMWSALAPVCGFHRDASADAIAAAVKHLPVWAFHGLKDDVVPPARTRDIIDALKQQGASPKLTEFPDANHNSWDPAYRDPELPKWLLSQTRSAR